MNQANIIPISKVKKAAKQFTKTKYANLVRHVSGVYHVRAKVNGRLFRKSLKTRSIEIAKARLDSELDRQRKLIADKGTFAGLVQEYEKRLADDAGLKPRSVAYRLETIKAIRASWPEVDKLSPAEFTLPRLNEWCSELKEGFSASRYNGMVQTMRGILQIAVERGMLSENPAKTKTRRSRTGLPYARVPLSVCELPSRAKFKAIIERLRAVPSRHRAADLVEFMAYTGARISAARAATSDCLDLARNVVRVPAVKYSDEPVMVPMIPEMQDLAKRLLKAREPGQKLFAIDYPRRSLPGACKEAGIAPLSPHDFRHLFATRCIESGVDIKTVATWLDHKDGGALLLKRYAHLLDEHSQAMAAKVEF